MTASQARRPAQNRPARGTRPANRRELILSAAAELFFRDGYAGVSMKEVADAVAITPAALYRYFSGKQDLLRAVISAGFTAVDTTLRDLLEKPAAEPGNILAGTLLEQRGIASLWHAEARYLPEDARSELRLQLRGIGARLARILRRNRPDLTPTEADFSAWCVLAILSSVSYHRLQLPAHQLTSLMADLTHSVAALALPPLHPAPVADQQPPRPWSPTRREAILRAAVRLFARDGFANVGMEDIGDAVGIAGPSIYNHFDAKVDILVAAMLRGNELLRADMRRQLDRAHSPTDAIDRLITSYCEFAFEYTDHIRLLTSDVTQLPPEERRQTSAAQRAYISEWSDLLRQRHPNWNSTETLIRIHAAFTVVNDLVATPHLRALEHIDLAITTVCRDLLCND